MPFFSLLLWQIRAKPLVFRDTDVERKDIETTIVTHNTIVELRRGGYEWYMFKKVDEF